MEELIHPAPERVPPPREAVEVYRRPLPERMASPARDPREVVEVYRRPDPPAVVEVYARPLPWLARPAPSPAPPPPRRRRSRKGLWIFLGCFALVTALATGAWALDWVRRPVPPEDWDPYDFWLEEEPPGETTIPTWPTGLGVELTVERDHGPALTAQTVYRTVNPAVVAVLADLDDDSVSVGTGVIFRQDGYVLTNYHVVEGGSACSICLDTGYRYEALFVAGDADSDLAVLKVDREGLPTAAFGDSDGLTVGDHVYAIGNPLGMELRGTLTDGIVSAIDRDVWVDGRTMTLLQTNAALNSGNSGGPLINEYGQVVGINTIKMTSRYSNIEGLGFAIPSAAFERLVNDLLAYGEITPEPVLGITVSQIGDEVAPGVWGIQVQEVARGSAAGLAGVQAGDYVLSAGGSDILSSRDLLRVRRQVHLGDELPMTLWRDGRTLEVTLVLRQPAG